MHIIFNLIFSHYTVGGLLIVGGLAWMLLAAFAGAMHPIPENPSPRSILIGLAAIALGILLIWKW